MKIKSTLLALGLIFSVHSLVFAQINDPNVHLIKIKFSPEIGELLKNSENLSSSDTNALRTGITTFDELLERYLVDRMERVFPANGRFSKRQEAAGLHLWYRLSVVLPASVTLEDCLIEFGSNAKVTLAEEEKPKVRVDQYPAGPNVPRVQPVSDEVFPNDPYFYPDPRDYYILSQWHFDNQYVANADVDLLSAWQLETGDPEVIVAVMDLEVQTDHFDLEDNIWINETELNGEDGVDDDGNGYIDDIHGYNFVEGTGDIQGEDHGTHVAGTIAARSDNGQGVAGMAGGIGDEEGVKIMSCAIISGGLFGELGGVEEAFIYAADHGAVIAQNSWGYLAEDDFEQSVKDAIDYFITYAGRDEEGNQIGPMKGGIVIFSAGNDDSDTPKYPAAYEKVMAVASTDYQDKKSGFSNYGDWVDIAAPGSAVVSTLAETSTSPYQMDEGVGLAWGTSMACPHVSGAAALIISRYGGEDFTPDLVWDRLIETTEDLGQINPDYIGLLGSGRLNAYQALLENDGIAPDAVTTLDIKEETFESVTLQWQASGSSGSEGKAHTYDLRYSTVPITDDNFDQASIVDHISRPSWSGQMDTVTLDGLVYNTTYYFALKSSDAYGYTSVLSNVAETKTPLPPVMDLSDAEITVQMYRGRISEHGFTISNAKGHASLSYEVFLPASETDVSESHSLDHILYALNEQHESLIEMIPDAHVFDRIGKNNISDGEVYDFLDGGNLLSTNKTAEINYSDDEVQSEPGFGNSGKYFTRAFPGLFVFAADIEDVTYFEIAGKLERNYQYEDLPGSVDGKELSIQSNGKTYTGFVKRIYNKRAEYHKGSFVPSLNHLVIIESRDKPGHTYSSDSEDDFHRINGLDDTQRLYYLAFASNNNDSDKGHGWISDQQCKEIMESFLAIVNQAWLSVDQSQATVEVGADQSLTLEITTKHLSVGTYQKDVHVVSNDPEQPETSFSVVLNVENEAPVFVESISDQLLRASDDALTFDLSEISMDPEEDEIKYWASSDNSNAAVVTVNDNYLSVQPKSAGETRINVGLNDSYDEGNSISFSVEVLEPITSVEPPNRSKPVLAVYPNPVTSSMGLTYTLESPTSYLKLTLLDNLGRLVSQLIERPLGQPAGVYAIHFDSNGLTPGIYFVQLQTQQGIQVVKLIKRLESVQ